MAKLSNWLKPGFRSIIFREEKRKETEEVGGQKDKTKRKREEGGGAGNVGKGAEREDEKENEKERKTTSDHTTNNAVMKNPRALRARYPLVKVVRGFSFSWEKCSARNPISSLLFVLIKGRTTFVLIKVGKTVGIPNCQNKNSPINLVFEDFLFLFFLCGYLLRRVYACVA